MEANHNPTCPIEGEPSRVPLTLVQRPADNISEQTARCIHHAKQLILDCLYGEGGVGELRVALQELNEIPTGVSTVTDLLPQTVAHMRKNPLTPVSELWEKAHLGDAEGEMRAEAEAERRADAAAELAAELASCDWEGWD